jgi:hypothetical protein
MAHGDTPDEALRNLDEARALYIRALVEKQLPVPRPQASTLTTAMSRPKVIWTQEPREEPTPGVVTQAAFP